MQASMPLDHVEPNRKKGAVRGRESRDQSLNTKLTLTEFAAVKAASEADGRAIGEWAREVILKEVHASSVSLGAEHLMTEIIGLQLFLTNALTPIVCGEHISSEQYEELMRNVKTNKRRAAQEVIAQYIEEKKEASHA
jgi:hypothetical protein